MVVEIIVICVAALCGQAVHLFGPRLLDDKKRMAELEADMFAYETRVDHLEADFKELKDRVSKQQLKGISR